MLRRSLVTSYNTAVYSPHLLDHFEHPRNAGAVITPNAVAQCENPICGDVLKLSVRTSDERISEIKFQAQGCVPAIACGSALTELVKGRSLDEAKRINKADIIRAFGELPPASGHAADLAIATLKKMLEQLAANPPR